MIYFCIPTYNEERTVGVVLWKLRQVMGELQRDYQIIVVDDASTDSTPAVLSPYIRVLPLTVFRNSEHRGYADSLELAVREALRRSPYPKRDAVIVIQADFTEDPDVVPAMLKRFEAGADLVATEVEIEENAPRAVRWGRRFMRWLMRRREWSTVGDPLSGLRAYRVVTLKRAVEARGASRLVTHQGWGAHVELLAQTVPHSRRNDVVPSTLKQHRLQRESRYSFMPMLREVRGAASGKAATNARVLPTDSVIAQPLPIALEPVQQPRDRHQKRGPREASQRRSTRERPARGEPRERTARAARPQAPERGERAERPERKDRTQAARGPRPPRPPRPETPTVTVTAVTAPPPAPAEGEAEVKRKRKRRPRRRKQRAQDTTQTTGTALVLAANSPTHTESASEAVADVPETEGQAQPRKKSRRGRRGGRGRRRGSKPDITSAENGEISSNTDSGEAPPPVAAQGD